MTFKLDLTRFAEKAGDNANQIITKVALDIYSKVIDRSPVDTGRFRGNWNFAYGNIDYSINGVPDKSGSATKASAAVKVLSNTSGQDIFITNNLPYAQRLENGYSSQAAPNAIVRLTVVEFKISVRSALRGL